MIHTYTPLEKKQIQIVEDIKKTGAYYDNTENFKFENNESRKIILAKSRQSTNEQILYTIFSSEPILFNARHIRNITFDKENGWTCEFCKINRNIIYCDSIQTIRSLYDIESINESFNYSQDIRGAHRKTRCYKHPKRKQTHKKR